MQSLKLHPRRVKIGLVVLYFPRGDVHRPPQPGLVTYSDHRSGIIDITAFGRNFRNLSPTTGVRHRNDPWLEEHPEHARENGVWDFVENFDLPEIFSKIIALVEACGGWPEFKRAFETQLAEHVGDTTMTVDQVESLLLELHAEHGDGESKKIAEIMSERTGQQWNYQKVNKNLRDLLKSEGADSLATGLI